MGTLLEQTKELQKFLEQTKEVAFFQPRWTDQGG